MYNSGTVLLYITAGRFFCYIVFVLCNILEGSKTYHIIYEFLVAEAHTVFLVFSFVNGIQQFPYQAANCSGKHYVVVIIVVIHINTQKSLTHRGQENL